VQLVPFELSLDGNFCDQSYKYLLDVFQLASKFTSRARQLDLANIERDEMNPTVMKQSLVQSVKFNDEVDQIKNALSELKTKGQPLHETQRDVQKIFLEQFSISEIRFSFTFSSSPILFREFTMNPTLKFFIVLLSNLKNVKLKFSKYSLQNQHMLMSIFTAQIRRFYWQECCNHTQLFKIVSSMGLFGNISDTLNNLTSAFKILVQRPFQQQDNKLKAVVVGSLVFVKDSVSAISGSVTSVFESLKKGVSFIVQYGLAHEKTQEMVVDKDLFEDDIEQASKSINNFSTPLTAIDTQNRIWLKILTREKQNYDVKKRLLRKQKEGMDGQQDSTGSAVVPVEMRYKRKQREEEHSIFYYAAVFTAKGVIFLPKKIVQTSANMVNALLQDEGFHQVSVRKVRPPRFVSFTMELEPYSEKKAFALEILNEINLNVFEAETIQQLYTMSNHVVIITGKRVICVYEHRTRGALRGN